MAAHRGACWSPMPLSQCIYLFLVGARVPGVWTSRLLLPVPLRNFVKPMQLGRVIGNVVCTIKSDALEGKKLMLVQPLDKQLKQMGRVIVALDSVGAGTGELIYWCRGKEASFPWPEQEVPTEASIVGIVDQVHLG
jgi:ethanolamine utilization protein EutN